MEEAHRRPVWSDAFTVPIAARISRRYRPGAVRVIKAIHTVAFLVIAGSILSFTWDGMRRQGGQRARVTAGIAIGETLIYGSNNLVCPLTPLAEALGADRGTVSDLYLPKPISERIPLIAGSALLVGLAFHLFAWWERRRS